VNAARGRLLVTAVRRFFTLLGGLFAVTTVCALAIGAVAGLSLARSIAVGLYMVGGILVVVGFVVGNRPPVRMRDGVEEATPWRSRPVRWASRQELDDALNSSAVFVIVGLTLVLIGIGFDGRRALF